MERLFLICEVRQFTKYCVEEASKTYTVIGIILALTFAGIYLAFLSSSQINEEKQFLENYYSLVDATTGVTENYHKEIEKWERDQYDNRKLVEITDSFLSEYDLLVDKATSFKAPQKYPRSPSTLHKKFRF